MFKYTLIPSGQTLRIDLPDKMKFDYDFLKATAHLLYQVSNAPYDQVIFRCKTDSLYDKMSRAYLYNLLNHIVRHKKKKAFWNSPLKALITSTVHSQKGADFMPIVDLDRAVDSDELDFYQFEGDAGVQKTVEELTRLMVDKNYALNPSSVKEFLSTTIGEIFSNSINHSEQDTIYFVFDIAYESDKYMLYVNIVDYGTTIVDSVKAYFKRTRGKSICSRDCINWAIQSGNTTRSTSGGYGLPTLIDYIKVVHGDLFIFSGDAYYRQEDKITEVNELANGYFAGTSVTFKVELLKTGSALLYDSSEDKLINISLDNV